MLHSDYSDYAITPLLYNSLITLPMSDWLQVKPVKLQKSAGIAHLFSAKDAAPRLSFLWWRSISRALWKMEVMWLFWFVCVFVSRITQKVMGRFAWTVRVHAQPNSEWLAFRVSWSGCTSVWNYSLWLWVLDINLQILWLIQISLWTQGCTFVLIFNTHFLLTADVYWF